MEFNINKKLEEFFVDLGAPVEVAEILDAVVLIALLGLLCVIADFIAKRILLATIKRLAKRTKSNWDDILVEKKVFHYLAHLAPAALIEIVVPPFFPENETVLSLILTLNHIYVIGVILFTVLAFLNSVHAIMNNFDLFKDKPLSSYVQLVKLIAYIIAGILILSIILGKSPVYFLGAFGAMTAIILLIFKDTILGLVASIQLSANDMVRVGDWVSMPKYGADGDVMVINLTTVKIRNWDQTISSVPTYAFISESFVNWRGMQDSGGRRIMRSVLIDVNSIKFCNAEMVEKFKKFQLIKNYLEERSGEIEKYNKEKNIDKSELINGRHLTNIGVFRKYMEEYLKNNPNIDKEKTCMVRQLEPTEKGIPIQLYAFSNDIRWPFYEGIQADIFDHILASVEFFELDVFQYPAGRDFKGIKHE